MALWEGPGLRDHSDGDDLGPILINFVHLTILIVTSLDHCVNDGCMIETLGSNGMAYKKFCKFRGRRRNTGSRARNTCLCQSRLQTLRHEINSWAGTVFNPPSETENLGHLDMSL